MSILPRRHINRPARHTWRSIYGSSPTTGTQPFKDACSAHNPALVFGLLLIAGVAFGIGMVGNVNRWLSDLPDYTDANAYLVSEPTEIVDCNGNKIASFYTQNRKSITKDEVSPTCCRAPLTSRTSASTSTAVSTCGVSRALRWQPSAAGTKALDYHPAACAQHHPAGGAVRLDHRA